MKLVADCGALAARLNDFADGALTPGECAEVEAHLSSCAACREGVQRSRAVRGLLNGAFAAEQSPLDASTSKHRLREITTGPQAPTVNARETQLAQGSVLESFSQRFGAAPWWAVSVALHVLVILLASLVTMTIGEMGSNEEIIVVTNIEKRPEAKLDEPQKEKPALSDILESKVDVQATDPNSTEQSNIVVPPDILAKAEIGDHFETINPDRPDTQSAFGNPDARMFHSVQGNNEPEGGGGSGGNSLMDSLIGVGGAASPGTGGGWGGGTGSGSGIGAGGGHGSFGARTEGGRRLMVMKHGGGKPTESAVDKALDWLARHQETDGHWDPRKYEGGLHNGTSEVGCTGLALLAFLGAGHSEKVGKYKENVQKAVKWFMDNQDKQTGQFRCRYDHNSSRMYGHGIATMALSEAAAMGRIKETREAAQKGVNFVSFAQNKLDENGSEREGWDYAPNRGTTDTSVTSWMALALKSAKIGGLHVDPACIEGTLRWLDASQGPDPYKIGIWYRGTIAEVKPQQEANTRMEYGPNPAAKEHSLIAAAALMRMYLGASREDPRVMASADYLLKKLPAWILPANPGNSGKRTCFYHLYYGTLTMFQTGGMHWKQWNEALKATLLPNQVKGGDHDGSWEPNVSVAGEWGGRVYTTAMGALCLEVYYRYLPIYRK